MEKDFEATAFTAPSEIDGRALMWTYESLDEDHELEQFFSRIIGFCHSGVVRDPQSSLASLRSWPVTWALNGFLERTWSSNLVSETIKIRRLAICIKAIGAANLCGAADQILGDFFQHRPALFQSVELGLSLLNWGNNNERKPIFFAQCIISCIIANVPQRNELWFLLTMHHLGISEPVLRGYLDHGDSVLLANQICLARQFVQNYLGLDWGLFLISLFERLQSNYNVQDTLPELQHEFCSLWNEIFEQRRNIGRLVLSGILAKLYPIYFALHGGPANIRVTQFRLCNVPGHLIHSASNVPRG